MWSKTIDEKTLLDILCWAFSLEPSLQVESLSVFFVCHHFKISNLEALYIIPGSRQTPHIIYCWKWDAVMYHLAMTKTHTKTKHFQVPPIEDQLMLGVSHVIEYIRTGKNNFIFVFKDV